MYYNELIKRLRNGLSCYGEKCLSCPDRKHCVTHYEHKAADAIEELQRSKWIKFETRELDDEEKGEYPEWDFIFCCDLPEDGQEILVSNGRQVWLDSFCNNYDGCYLDSGNDVSGLWWMPLPEPPKESE